MGSYLYVGIVTEVGFSGKIGSSLEPVLLEKVKESLSNDMNLPLQKEGAAVYCRPNYGTL